MIHFSEELAKLPDSWASIPLGEPNKTPVYARAMSDIAAPFHTHPVHDEMFIVLTGIVFIDLESKTETLTPGMSLIVHAGQRHRARVIGRAELIVIGGGQNT